MDATGLLELISLQQQQVKAFVELNARLVDLFVEGFSDGDYARYDKLLRERNTDSAEDRGSHD